MSEKAVIHSNEPKMLVIAGPNGSGKSSLVTEKVRSAYEERIINPDNYAEGLLSVIPDRTERYLFAMDACKYLRTSLLENKKSFGFETVGSTEEKIQFVKKAIEKGYKIEFIFVTLKSPELCIERIKERVSAGGHDVDPEKVYSRYARSMKNLHYFLEISDRADVYDNSGSCPTLVFVKKKGEYQLFIDPEKCDWVKKYISCYFENSKKMY